jgi:hypothetical protein
MTHSTITTEQVIDLIEAILVRNGLTFREFLDSNLDDYEEADLRELWLLYHDLLVEKTAA